MAKDIKDILIDLREWAYSSKPLDNILFGVNQTMGGMKMRIFNSEQGAKDVKGAKLGKYSKGYAAYRQREGRQNRYVDLEFTGALRRNIQTVRAGTQVTIAITNQDERLIASYLEKQYGKSIFSLSKEEQVELDAVIRVLFQKDIEEILNGTGS
jgi:hypothetical protein